MATLQEIGASISSALSDFGSVTGRAASQANNVSRQAQSAQAAFNSDAMNTANSIGDSRLLGQYGFNSAMMASANEYNTQSWQNAADWNEIMWQKQADFNAEQAELNRRFNASEAQKLRDWQTEMSNTQYQRAMSDMEKAGLNPILAYSQGGAGVPGGAAASGSSASVGGAQMNSAQSNMAQGGLINPESTSINNYTGQMETLSGMLGLITAMIAAGSSAQSAAQTIADTAGEAVEKIVPKEKAEDFLQETKDLANGGIWDFLKYAINNRPGSFITDFFNNPAEKKKGQITSKQDEAQYLRYNAWNNSTWKYTRPKG